MPHTLLILTRDQADYEEHVSALHLSDLRILAPQTEEEIRKALPEATIVLGSPPILKKYIHAMPQLQWVQSDFAGVDALTEEGMRRDYLLTNVKGVYGRVMAEYVLGYILFFERNIGKHHENQRQHLWKDEVHAKIAGRTVGIAGTGSIGREIAAILKSFNMRVLGMNQNGEDVDGFDAVFPHSASTKFFPELDYLVTVLPKTPATDNFVNAKVLGLMKPSSVFINIGRGNAVHDEDLADALKEEKIRAAVLDVFRSEPLPENHPFWNLPNCYITPHISGHCVSDRVFTIFAENYRHFLCKESLKYPVDFGKGY